MSGEYNIAGVQFDHTRLLMDREQIDLLLMLDDDEDSTALVRELFGLFKEESADKLDGLDAVCAENDTDGLRKIVHFIAGSAGNLGMARMCGLYRGIEQAILEETLSDLSASAAPIRSAFEDGCRAFQEEFKV